MKTVSTDEMIEKVTLSNQIPQSRSHIEPAIGTSELLFRFVAELVNSVGRVQSTGRTNHQLDNGIERNIGLPVNLAQQ
jgi:hypothetical protein